MIVIGRARDLLAIKFCVNTCVLFRTTTRESWEACKTFSFNFWGSCRTSNCGSPNLYLHVFTTWLRGLASLVCGRVIVLVVHCECRTRGALPHHQVTQQYLSSSWILLEDLATATRHTQSLGVCTSGSHPLYSIAIMRLGVGIFNAHR